MTEMLDLAVTEPTELLEPGSLVGYRAVRWLTWSAEHERRQEIARFRSGRGSAPHFASRVVVPRYGAWSVRLSLCGGVEYVGGRSVQCAAWISPRRLAALPGAAHGRGRAIRLAFRAGGGQYPRG